MGPERISASPWMMLPFGVLLAAIALAPTCCPAWWSRHYAKAAYGLGAMALVYYLVGLHAWGPVLHIAHEYVSFIVLIGSLFVVSGGIHITVKGEATPRVNVLFLLVGALLSNLLGTTGASMLLIRPWLRMNQYRVTAHHVVFFIFIVSNVGGCLTPLGDPPLLLGYLEGVPFWWVAQHCWQMWAVALGFLLALFYVIDAFNYHRAPTEVRARLAAAGEQWRFGGMWNLVYLLGILAAVFINHPALLREGLMAALAAASYFSTRPQIHEANHFHFQPLTEVAVLFAGIFATLLPVLDWLQNHASSLVNPSPGVFYWASGLLSSFLDSAPAYLGLLNVAFGRFTDPQAVSKVHDILQNHGQAGVIGSGSDAIGQAIAALQKYDPSVLATGHVTANQIQVAFLLSNGALSQYVVAISLGAVLFGALTYLGNGPNLMVKAIADHQKVRTPGFLAFIFRYALPCLAPVLVLVWWLFFRT